MAAGLRAEQQALYVKDMYNAEYESYTETPTKHDQIFKVVTKGVKGAGHKETQLLGAGDLERHTVEGQDINFKSPKEGWAFYVKYHTFSDGLSLTKEAVADTVKLGDLLKTLANSWGLSLRVLKETFAARVFNNGGALLGDFVFNGSHTGNTAPYGDMLYDNKPLFNLIGNARSTKGGGTYYNSVASLTLDPANFETVYNLHTATNNRDERDRVMENPADTIITRRGAEHFKAVRILESTQLPGGQLNDTNVYKSLVTPIDWDYLTDGTTYKAFYVGKRQHRDFQWHDRQLPEIDFFRDNTNRGYKASIDTRFGAFIKNFRMWSRGGGTSA